MTRRLQVEADGGSRGNPGPAAYGSVVRDPVSGQVLASEGTTIGEDTNNVAEYRGLIAALALAHEIDPAALVEARLDSKLVVEQMSGKWQVKNDRLRPLVREAFAAFEPTRVTYKWVPRELNKTADALVNEALDGKPSRQIFWDRVDSPRQLDLGAPDASTPSAAELTSTAQLVGVPDEAPERVVAARVSLPGFAPDLGAPTTVLLARHGVTAHTLEKRFSGRSTDLPLAPIGVEQAEALGHEVALRGGVDAIVASPVRRARQTAEIVAGILGRTVEVDAGFAEAEFGQWDGLTFAEVKQQWPGALESWLASTDVAPPGGESFSEVRDRVDQARHALLARHAGRRVLVVSHVTPIKTMVGLALDAPLSSLFRMHMAPCSLTTVQWWADGNSSLVGFGEASHLRGIAIPDGA